MAYLSINWSKINLDGKLIKRVGATNIIKVWNPYYDFSKKNIKIVFPNFPKISHFPVKTGNFSVLYGIYIQACGISGVKSDF